MDQDRHILFFFLVALVAALGIALAILSWRQEQKRLAALRDFCAVRGLSFSPARDHELSRTFEFIPEISNGRNRYAQDVVHGTVEGSPILAFEHHYETRSKNAQGHTSTRHHYHSVVAIELPRSFPDLCISPEGILSKIAQAIGYDDIDFESHEFSRAFCVRSKDRRFAYDFCNPAMMEFLLSRRSIRLTLHGSFLTTVHDGRQEAALLEQRLADLLTMRRLLPEYLFS
jgi:hypothetical protein